MGTEGKNENNIKTGKLLSAAPVLILIVMAVLTAEYLFLLQQNVTEDAEQIEYQYHIAMIASNKDTSFWKQVYEGAVEEGKKYGAYVEQVGEELAGSTSVSDAVNIAVYEEVFKRSLHSKLILPVIVTMAVSLMINLLLFGRIDGPSNG